MEVVIYENGEKIETRIFDNNTVNVYDETQESIIFSLFEK